MKMRARPYNLRGRLMLLAGALGLCGVVLVGRAAQMQLLDKEFYAHQGDQRFLREVPIPTSRGMIVDRNVQSYTLMASAEGGMEIEEVAAATPEKIIKHRVDPVTGLRPYEAREVAIKAGFKGNLNKIADMMVKMSEAALKRDAVLVEINPLFVDESGTPLALDTKFEIDDNAMYRHKDNAWFESQMKLACTEGRRICTPSGLGVWVFANKETPAWEAMLGALVDAGWIVTASWPIDTESGNRLRAKDSAALASSVHLVCRPRESSDGSVRTDDVGNWRSVLSELGPRIHDWLPRLAPDGQAVLVVQKHLGADSLQRWLGEQGFPTERIVSKAGFRLFRSVRG